MAALAPGRRGDTARARPRTLRIETPSWAYGNSGTGFKVFAQPGVPRTVREKIDAAAVAHPLTDFNSRFYADDDLVVGAADPFQLFRIMCEVDRGGGLDPVTGVAFMLEQCHDVELRIPGQVRSVCNVQEATAKALLVDREALKAAQLSGDVIAANDVLMDAYNTDVRPLVAEPRVEQGLDPDPVGAYRRSGYQDRIARERVGGEQAGWGA